MILHQIYHEKNEFEWVKKIAHFCLVICVTGYFHESRSDFGQQILKSMDFVSRLVGKFRNFPIFPQLSPNQKYIYTRSIQIFLDVLKSYESESFISAGLSPVAQDYDTPWHPSFVGILENSQIPTCTALPYLLAREGQPPPHLPRNRTL